MKRDKPYDRNGIKFLDGKANTTRRQVPYWAGENRHLLATVIVRKIQH
jgi:hypothetical protein